MTVPSKAVQRACKSLRERVRFTRAGFDLPGMSDEEATRLIKATTQLYMETYVVPLIDAIERGDTRYMKTFFP